MAKGLPGLATDALASYTFSIEIDRTEIAQFSEVSGLASEVDVIELKENTLDGKLVIHKAPANEVIRGAIDLEVNITKAEHDSLNPVAVNCIRSFPGRGIRVWGARTLSSDPEWRYLNVRRLFNYLEESIMAGTQWVVFEPNDEALWAKIRRTIAAFLVMEWRAGALFGATPDEAFYVKCDRETNPAEGIDAGQVVCEVGIAPVKPAEFVIFRIAQIKETSA